MRVIIVKGGPGTRQVVLAVNLVADFRTDTMRSMTDSEAFHE
jgi:hypothetical protein